MKTLLVIVLVGFCAFHVVKAVAMARDNFASKVQTYHQNIKAQAEF